MPKSYVIAGGSHGIGYALVQRLLESGADVLVLSRTLGELELKPGLTHQCCDFTDPSVELALPEKISGVAYCPGSINLRSFRSLKPDDFQADLNINLLGAVRFLQLTLPSLKRAGKQEPASVVLFSTVAVTLGLPMHASIAAAKGAIEGLSRSLAAEWAPHIRVNCIAPALTQSPLSERFFANPDKISAMNDIYPLERTGTLSDQAAMASFLLSPESSWMTGQVLHVDGGLSSLKPK